jgi:predicted O-linked N-acetylglucosamine transferase (SPINDLY family)
VTFGCFNNLAKITDPLLRLWGQLLHRVPHARLQLKGSGLGEAPVRTSYHERFARLGVPSDRVDLLERTADTRGHLARYGDVDIALDTFPYHGTTTTCVALWMGVPVISLVGDRHMSRVGASLLTAVGRPEWLAQNADDYVHLAATLASEPARLAKERGSLRAALGASPLLDHAAQASRFGAALRDCWGAWCDRKVKST